MVIKSYPNHKEGKLLNPVESNKQRETTDDDLFSKSAPILTTASEVAFHTMNTSAFNAEELRREESITVSQKGSRVLHQSSDTLA